MKDANEQDKSTTIALSKKLAMQIDNIWCLLINAFMINFQNYSKVIFAHNIIFLEKIVMPLTTKQIIIISYAAYLVLLSLITFIAYGVDKKKAIKGKYRTKEKHYYCYHS